MSALLEQLGQRADALARRSVAEMYQDPFWQARYGSPGRRNAEQDARHHLSYLAQALVAGDAAVMTRYARRLQPVLVSRGMCTRHLAQIFERLRLAISEQIVGAAPAAELLQAAAQALAYTAGPARELQELGDPLATSVVELLALREPGWFAAVTSYASIATFESLTESEKGRCKQDVLDLLSYVADSLHAGRPELLAAHVAWASPFFEQRKRPWAPREVLRSLGAFLEDSSIAAARRPGSVPPRPERITLRPLATVTTSQPPPPPPPLPVSPELASAVRALLDAALNPPGAARSGAAPPREAP